MRGCCRPKKCWATPTGKGSSSESAAACMYVLLGVRRLNLRQISLFISLYCNDRIYYRSTYSSFAVTGRSWPNRAHTTSFRCSRREIQLESDPKCLPFVTPISNRQNGQRLQTSSHPKVEWVDSFGSYRFDAVAISRRHQQVGGPH
jgi:hypothetical protein